MSLRSVLVVVLALFFGGSAAIGINALRAPPPAAVETVPVVVAAVDVPRFSTLSGTMLKTRDFPKDMAPPGAFNRSGRCGRPRHPRPAGHGRDGAQREAGGAGTGRGMAPGIAEGMRAFTPSRPPNVASGVAGFILPGNKVDVLLNVNDSNNGSVTTTLLQNLEILAVDQRHPEAPADNKVDPNQLRLPVTLLVTPRSGSSKLDLGQNKGTLHLSLRNPGDTKTEPVRRATMAELGLGSDGPAPGAVIQPQQPPAPPPRIRIFRGGVEQGAAE